MKYGCIGERLGHSFSKEIHALLADYSYELCEVKKEELDSFMTKRGFSAINVTIPYKELVIPYLSHIDAFAKEIGAVNTVVNKDGELFGYNTDFFGMRSLIEHAGISVDGKKVVILGTGGTSKTALAVARSLGAGEFIRAGRTAKEGSLSYGEIYTSHADADIIINTTPVGMFPAIFDTPIDLERFSNLSGVIDAVYNPLRTPLILSARKRGIPAEGGLYMLVAQAVRASEIFLDSEYPKGTLDRIYSEIYRSKENIVLTGMPASGKSTVGKILAKRLSRPFIDTDELIVKHQGKDIPAIFAEVGEEGFRDMETEAVREAAAFSGAVIATGGGAVLRSENVCALSENGRIYFIDRPLDALVPTESRPLSKDRAQIERRYKERYSIYCNTAEVKIDADTTPDGVADRILEDFCK